jgi:transposase
LETVTEVMDCRRQEVEIPVVDRRFVKICPYCGLENKGTFPNPIKAGIQYGKSVKSLMARLSIYQFLALCVYPS